MMRLHSVLASSVMATLIFATVLCNSALLANQLTAIDKYVNKTDRTYRARIAETIDSPQYETVLIDMTSQRWLNKSVVDRPVWQHRLVVVVPKQLHNTDIGFLYISGGSNTAEPRKQASELVAQIAVATNTVVAELRQVPNQPLVFHGDGQERYEDDLIAYAWVQYLRSGNPIWLPRNAMVKSAVRAMDSVTKLMRRHRSGQHPVNRFVVAGGSKRGWTTWLTGAMDNRVVAIVPVVIDVLNVNTSMKHHFSAYGFWAPSIGDYVNHGITHQMTSKALDQLYELVDPHSYVDRLQMPKFVVNASGDQFFLPDSSRFYWQDLRGPKWLRYVPNTDHGLGRSDSAESIAAFHFAQTRNIALPNVSWQYQSDSEVNVLFDRVPQSLSLWRATNENARDFRMETFGPGYRETTIDTSGITPGIAKTFSVRSPSKGWTAWYLEMSYDIGFIRPLKLSTEIRVTPDKLPFEQKAFDKPTSITLVIPQPPNMHGFYDAIKAALESSQAGKDLSLTTQHGQLYLNFTPTGNAGFAALSLAQFLRTHLQDDSLSIAFQLESGKGATVLPLMH